MAVIARNIRLDVKVMRENVKGVRMEQADLECPRCKDRGRYSRTFAFRVDRPEGSFIVHHCAWCDTEVLHEKL